MKKPTKPVQDAVTAERRLRGECLVMAVGITKGATTEDIVRDAQTLYEFVSDGKTPGGKVSAFAPLQDAAQAPPRALRPQ